MINYLWWLREGQERVISLAASYEEAHEKTHKRDQKLNLGYSRANDNKSHGSMTWLYIFEIPPKPLSFFTSRAKFNFICPLLTKDILQLSPLAPLYISWPLTWISPHKHVVRFFCSLFSLSLQTLRSSSSRWESSDLLRFLGLIFSSQFLSRIRFGFVYVLSRIFSLCW